MNNVNLFGRLAANPNEFNSSSGTKICNFRICLNKHLKNSDSKPIWISCVAFGKTAENICQYFNKGDRILISGELDIRDKKNSSGAEYQELYVIVSNFDFIENKEKKNSSVIELKTPPASEEDEDEALPF